MIPEHSQKPGLGQLFIVATPIGNLGDMTVRAIETLKSVDLIAAEDTRHSRHLLQHYGINTPMLACHEHNEMAASRSILKKLLDGLNIALISDSGTPLINDPGYRLLSLLKEHHVSVIPVPGPCSLIAALSASGLPTNSFFFLGFLPRSGASRKRVLESVCRSESTQIILESPKRLLKTLADLKKYCPPPRSICVARELTKLHEEFVDGNLDEVIAHFQTGKVLGEVVLLIAPACPEQREVSDNEIIARLNTEELHKLPPTTMARNISQEMNVHRDRVYKLVTQLKTL
ncbi:MAG: 16S rRNA (cytidine(1402)-2'-O)-methyltransferase [Mariprofundaceae bacterium]